MALKRCFGESALSRVQNAGHIHIESGRGDWPLSLSLLRSLTDEPTILMAARTPFEPLATL
ncbi:hypothetical protein GCM10023165_18980 [Variovorax defluvii]|uniref:Uncharacterized protein n=1 Tax=Variovorax defluvii TaxID=913761 RepID=A0ABP8HHR0_9BURK